jgi:N-acetylmuramic acid 6-phosphate etherase
MTEPIAKNLLGVECGGTRTTAAFCTATGATFQTVFGPANLRLLTDSELEARLCQIADWAASKHATPDSVAIGMAGARTDADRARIRTIAERLWPGVPCHATNDLETALAAADPAERPKVLILSGTGSCCYGRTPRGRTVRYGGWGHILGDRASGYDIGRKALQAVALETDRTGRWPTLGSAILASLELNSPEALIDWAKDADKTRIAGLTVTVFAQAAKQDRLARRILSDAARQLAEDGAQCARLLAGRKSGAEFILAGSLLVKQPGFANQIRVHLRTLNPGAIVRVLERESVWGAVELAAKAIHSRAPKTDKPAESESAGVFIPRSAKLSPTEQRNPRSMTLDKLSTLQAVELMAREDARIPRAILKVKAAIARAIDLIVASLRSGGRLFYIGAGSSGRLGVLDASEIPPTFRAPAEWVQGIMAGGYKALWSSIEGAEDSPAEGAEAVRFRGVRRGDMLIGIAASGRTPFVWGALHAARELGAKTALLCFNPHLEIEPGKGPDVIIAPCVGPEVLTGSTRLKAGTATKMILNMLTTLSMVRLGKVMSNLMVDVNASNQKLRERAVRIVHAITGAEPEAAHAALETCGWIVKDACRKLSEPD